MNTYEMNLSKMLRLGHLVILLHIPIFIGMAKYFDTQMKLAIFAPIVIFLGQFIFPKLFKSNKFGATLMGLSVITLSAVMIHLGKGMIEWHFHIFVSIGVLSLYANPLTIIVAALVTAIHHLAFYFLVPSSLFNYEASFAIVVIHALFVVAETIACTYMAYRFKKVLEMQDQINQEITPLITDLKKASSVSKSSFSDLSQMTKESSSSVFKISSSSTQISQMIESTKKQIESTLLKMTNTKESLDESSEAMSKGEDFLQSLKLIQRNMDTVQSRSKEQLDSVVSSVNTISNKTSIINDIVFQTKLLSFNASVEAARAGEHGKGFSVVAEEIGNLASNSGKASQEINDIVMKSKVELENSVESISKSLIAFKGDLEKAFKNWQSVSSTLTSSFSNVKENSLEQESSLKEIAVAAKEQDLGIKELNQSLMTVQNFSQKSVSQIKSLGTVVEDLDRKSEILEKLNSKIAS